MAGAAMATDMVGVTAVAMVAVTAGAMATVGAGPAGVAMEVGVATGAIRITGTTITTAIGSKGIDLSELRVGLKSYDFRKESTSSCFCSTRDRLAVATPLSPYLVSTSSDTAINIA
jgi:hypothetical protein